MKKQGAGSRDDPASDEQNKRALQQLIERHASQLSEHFGAVQIVASVVNAKGTSRFAAGEGDWYARVGLANTFVNSNSAEELAWHFRQILPKGGGG